MKWRHLALRRNGFPARLGPAWKKLGFTWLFTLAVVPAGGALAAAQQTSRDAREAVMVPINGLLAGVAARDPVAVLAEIRGDGEATIVTEAPDGSVLIRHPTWAQFVGGIKPGPEKFEPRIFSSVVLVDGNMAMAWTPYVFLVNGKVHHCGVNHFDLIRAQGNWKILNVSYDIRTSGCAG